MYAENKPPMMVRNSNGVATAGTIVLLVLFGPAFVDMTLDIFGGMLIGTYGPESLPWAVLIYRVGMYALVFYSIRSVIATALLSWSMKIALRSARQ